MPGVVGLLLVAVQREGEPAGLELNFEVISLRESVVNVLTDHETVDKDIVAPQRMVILRGSEPFQVPFVGDYCVQAELDVLPAVEVEVEEETAIIIGNFPLKPDVSLMITTRTQAL